MSDSISGGLFEASSYIIGRDYALNISCFRPPISYCCSQHPRGRGGCLCERWWLHDTPDSDPASLMNRMDEITKFRFCSGSAHASVR